jgi:hypothetical protein
MFAGSGRFPPVDGSMPGLAPATIFGRCEVDLGRGTLHGSPCVGSGGLPCNFRRRYQHSGSSGNPRPTP